MAKAEEDSRDCVKERLRNQIAKLKECEEINDGIMAKLQLEMEEAKKRDGVDMVEVARLEEDYGVLLHKFTELQTENKAARKRSKRALDRMEALEAQIAEARAFDRAVGELFERRRLHHSQRVRRLRYASRTRRWQ